MSKAHHLKPRKKILFQEMDGVPLNFLLGATDGALEDYELARLAAIADLRKQIQELLDALNQQMALASLIRWFRGHDRQTLKHSIENEETAEEWAKRMIRDLQRGPEELLPVPSLPPGAAHLAAAIRYQKRNIAEGKCSECPKPLAHNSVEFCEEHLAKARAREQRKKALSVPGSTEYLYAGETPSTHGRQPSTLASLEMNREKKTRAVLAELGIPPESAAVSLKAAKEALLRVMPSKAKALPAYDLFQAAQIPTGAGRRSTTGYKALKELLALGKVERMGKAHPLLQFKTDAHGHFQQEEPTETRKPKHLSRTKQNEALLKVMRGKDRNEE